MPVSRSSLTEMGSSSEALSSAGVDILTSNLLPRAALNSVMNFSGHATFVAKELEKLQEPQAGSSATGEQESVTPPVDPSEMAERHELARAAQAVSG